MSGLFVTLEGPEGGGKTTQATLLVQFLEAEGYSVRRAREPGGTRIGDQIRSCLHDVRNTDMVPASEFLLYSASRAQLVHEVIRPALSRGEIVVCDRYYDSSLAYQGHGRGLDLSVLATITQFATGGLTPDLTLLFDIDVELGLARRTDGGDEMNRLDLEALAFHRRVRVGFQRLAQAQPERWVVLDAARPQAAVQRDVRHAVLGRLPGRGT
jgi:dTMP kinase